MIISQWLAWSESFPLGISVPPIHPILVNFTAALVPASLISDILGKRLKKESLTSAAWWMMLYAALITPLTVIAGWLWLRTMPPTDDPQMNVHKWLGTATAFVLVGLTLWRWQSFRKQTAPTIAYLLVTTVVLGSLMLQGHIGGVLSFGASDPFATPAVEPAAIPSTIHAAAESTTQPAGIVWKDHLDMKE